MSDLGLDIAASGINAQQALLDTAAQNLSNASTPGYATETVNLATMPTESGTGVGQGVTIQSVTGANDAVQEALNLAAAGQLGAANQTQSIQASAEQSFPEPSTTGLSAQLDQFFQDLSALAAEPTSSGASATVVQDAGRVAGTLNTTYSQLTQASSVLVSDLGTGSNGEGLVAKANQLINQIAQLNNGIIAGVGSGQNPNELIDQRRAAVASLAGLLGVSATTSADGSMTVSAGGIQLVAGTTASDLATTSSAGTNQLEVVLASTASSTPPTAVPAGGQIGAVLTGVNSTIPQYQQQLSAVADSLATQMNTLQAAGLTAAGTPGPSTFFTNGSTTSGGTTTYTYTAGLANAASLIQVNPALVADPAQIATASAASSTPGQPTLDGSNAQAMAAIGQSSTSPTSAYQQLVGLVGSQTQQANNTQQAAQAQSDTATAALSSVEGVNSNMQTVDVIAAQKAFQAIASVINSINQSFQSLLQAV